ncbi:MAG TPA: SPFH domain-containing protein [Oligoflexus sp.]|uniref:SPFH domain-containing protein n=1 Tax=Oligoflexus sp. TaxID=1971216 RepID=UPI002D586CFB|nr:SPFH domain-containing protein [Oligoflexus sp.]HYX36041.1 SPFH domain-containing protein [Oligoflexus sp.]
MTNNLTMIFALIGGLLLIPCLALFFRMLTIQVEDEAAAIVTSFGKWQRTIRKPGLLFYPQKIWPWVQVKTMSMKRDFRHYEEIHVNDRRGTTVVIDLWIELSITSPENALFRVENFEKALQSLLTNSTTSILGNFEFQQILSNRGELGRILRDDIREETSRWGLEIDLVFISKLSLLPDVAQQLFDTVAAHLDKAKLDIEETGRLEAALLEAETSAKIASLIAEAQGQYALGVGKAYHRLSKNQELLRAYRDLYDLSLMKPQRTVAFSGFSGQEISALEAAMAVPNIFENVPIHSSRSAARQSAERDGPQS